jgi:hypothetical protein
MQENIGNLERWLRVAAGGALVLGGARALGARGALAPALVLASGALVLETALTRVCPLNALLGVDTRRLGTSSEEPAEFTQPAGRAGGTGDAAERAAKDIGAAQRPPADS